MASHDFVTVDVFTTQRFGGNPLAVFPNAAGLTDRGTIEATEKGEQVPRATRTGAGRARGGNTS